MEDSDARVRVLLSADLPDQQLKIIRLLKEGLSYSQIGEQLYISKNTVQYHVLEIYRKLGLDKIEGKRQRQLELVLFASVLEHLPEDQQQQPEQQPKEPPKQELAIIQVLDKVLDDDRGQEERGLSRGEQPGNIIDQRRSTRWYFIGDNQRPMRRLLLNPLFLGLLLVPFVFGLVIGVGVTGSLARQGSPNPEGAVPGSVVPTETSIAAVLALEPTTPTVMPAPTVCGEATRVAPPDASRFLRSQGLSAFTVENTNGSVLNNKIRALALDGRGLWIGYYMTDQNKVNGLGHYDGKTWADCSQAAGLSGKNVNALAIDHVGRVWVAVETDGVRMWDGIAWHTYNTVTGSGLPSDQTFGLAVDNDNTIWVATLEGIAKYNGESGQPWSTVYSAATDGVLPFNNTHAIAFDGVDNIWVGHISNGVSQFSKTEKRWIHYQAQAGGLSGNDIRSIVVQNEITAPKTQGVWFATADGGISRYTNEQWVTYHVADGLPSEEVVTLAIDHYGRIWAGTSNGVVYFDGDSWIWYDSLPTLSIALGAECTGCPLDLKDHVWTGTSVGIGHSRLPYPDQSSIVTGICFSSARLTRTCPPIPPASSISGTAVISLTYPADLTPEETFQVETSIAPNLPYTLTLGDQLVDVDDPITFGLLEKFDHIAIPENTVVAAGQPFVFVDHNKPFMAPPLEGDETQRTFISTWRLWMHGRYSGPYIQIIATVRRSTATPSPAK